MAMKQVDVLVAGSAGRDSDPEETDDMTAVTIDVQVSELGVAHLHDLVEASLQLVGVPFLEGLPGREDRYRVHIPGYDVGSEFGCFQQSSPRSAERVVHHNAAEVVVAAVEAFQFGW